MEWQSRTELLLGKERADKLQNKHVLVAGVGGVGAYTIEMLARAGVGELTIVDADVVKPSNRNRQLIALSSTEDKLKVDIMKDRLLDINSKIKVNTFSVFLKEDTTPVVFDSAKYDYVVDAIDSLSPKVFFIRTAIQRNIPIISSMGAGGKLDPTQIKIDDISKSYNCKLARMVRRRLHKFNIKSGFKVVFSPEEISKDSVIFIDDERNKKTTVGTISYMPSLFGIFAASHVIRELAD